MGRLQARCPCSRTTRRDKLPPERPTIVVSCGRLRVFGLLLLQPGSGLLNRVSWVRHLGNQPSTGIMIVKTGSPPSPGPQTDFSSMSDAVPFPVMTDTVNSNSD